jgi:deoxyhypusine synthase
MVRKKPALEKFRDLSAEPVGPNTRIDEMVEGTYWAHNARSLRDACEVFCEMAADGDCVVGLSLGGALVPAGLGESALIPLMKAHLVDWIISTGANLYHDLHALLGYEMKMGGERWNDPELREQGIVRIHNLVFDQDALFQTDEFLQRFVSELQDSVSGERMSTSRFCRMLGEKLLSVNSSASRRSVLAVAAEEGIPVFCPAIADSSIGMNLAALALTGGGVSVDSIMDINESSAIVYGSKKEGRSTGVVILGGGVSKNFQLQTEPHIHEVLGLPEHGHDFFIQFTDARVDSGGLSGATPSEAVTWGKIDSGALSKTVVCYADCTLVVPIFASYVLSKLAERKSKRLGDRIDSYVAEMRRDYEKRLQRRKA